jgi:hypothetical protein
MVFVKTLNFSAQGLSNNITLVLAVDSLDAVLGSSVR